MARTYRLPIFVSLFVLIILSAIQVMVDKPMLMLERFFTGGGWIEIGIIIVYGFFLSYKMQVVSNSSKWRLISWSVFSIFFFLQLILGILVSEKFLLTGKLHIPVPAMMISGPIYRGQLSIMTLLFLSTLILSGPAWCSQLCYFGAIDAIAARKHISKKKKIKHLIHLKSIIIILIITTTLLLRLLNISVLTATLAGISFGIIGLFVILLASTRNGKMTHCIAYCPVGSIVNLFKYISPFRMIIDKKSCTQCMHCTSSCKYDALKASDIKRYRPGFTCTLCGDCLQSCTDNAIQYRFPGAKPHTSRAIYLFITISLHLVFIAMGRI